MKLNLVSAAKHKAGGVLSVIKEGIGIVLDGTCGPINEKQRDFLETSERNVKRLALLLENVFLLQKLQQGLLDLNLEENDLAIIVNEAAKGPREAAEERGLALSIDIGTELPKIRSDKMLISRVIKSIIDNAVRFSDKGTVSITATKNGKGIKLAVKDNGLGIAKEDLENVFVPFEPLHKNRSGDATQLALAKAIIEKHNGKIWIESELGKGTSVFVELDSLDV